MVIRDNAPPAFWLRLLRPCAEEHHLDLNILDAICLLISRRLPIELERARADTNWDDALQGLLHDHGRQEPHG